MNRLVELQKKMKHALKVVELVKEKIEDCKTLENFKPECISATVQKHEALIMLKGLQSILEEAKK